MVAAVERGKMKTSKMLYFALLTVVALLLASCATQPAPGGFDPPGILPWILARAHHFLCAHRPRIQQQYSDIRIPQ